MELLVKKQTYLVKEDINSYTYLVSKDDKEYLVFDFADNLEAFDNFKFATKRLKNCGIKIPEVLVIDKKNHRFLVEYISGPTCFDLLVEKDLDEDIIQQVFNMNFKARINGLRLDFAPECFIYKDKVLYYMPFTFTRYIRDEDFTQKELRLWFYTNEFKDLLISKGIKIDNSRLMNEYERNKQLVLTVVKYFK